MLKELADAARHFIHHTRAGATAYAAFGIAVMTIGGTALVVDHVRLVGHRDLLQNPPDAASMAATHEPGELPRSLSDAELRPRLEPVAQNYAALNVLQDVNDPDLGAEDISVALDIDRNAGTAGATVRADIGKTPMSDWLFGYSGPGTIAGRSGVECIGDTLEVVLAPDVSRSMNFAAGNAGLRLPWTLPGSCSNGCATTPV